MTDAMAAAVDAVLAALLSGNLQGEYGSLPTMEDAIDILASMSDAGWVMVRDVPWSEWTPATDGDAPVHSPQFTDGWNACRAAMLADPPPER